jgi:hypothetical protein
MRVEPVEFGREKMTRFKGARPLFALECRILMFFLDQRLADKVLMERILSLA